MKETTMGSLKENIRWCASFLISPWNCPNEGPNVKCEGKLIKLDNN
jgi:hypothetical protein